MNGEQIIMILHLNAISIGIITVLLWPRVRRHRRHAIIIALHAISLLFEATAILLSLLIIHGVVS
jgi:hypothetical protein